MYLMRKLITIRTLKEKLARKQYFLKSITVTGNKKFSDAKISKFFDNLVGKNITFSDLVNASLRAQSLYRKNGFITTRVLIPKQDF